MGDTKKENVGLYRKAKRWVRSKIKWNDRRLRTQLMINLCTIFIIFFSVYSLVVFVCTKYVYLSYFEETVEGDLDPILEDRLDYSTQAVATTFYMVDKLGIDVALRLSGVYQSATTFDPFPIRADAEGYGLYDWETLSGDQRIYNAGVACKSGIDSPTAANHPPLRQLKHIWQNSVLIGIGQERKVNAERIIFMYGDDVCVYPAQNFGSFRWQTAEEWTSQRFYADLTAPKEVEDNTTQEAADNTKQKPADYWIERNGEDYFGESEDKFTTFYAPLKERDSAGVDQTVGVVGFQLNQKNYEYLLPAPILEPPYPISFIAVLDKHNDETREIWHLIDPGSDLTED